MKYSETHNFINGKATKCSQTEYLPVISPVDGQHLSNVYLSAQADLDQAVKMAEEAFKSWSKIPIKERAQVFYLFKTLLERDRQSLAELISEENGKTKDEALAEIDKAVELTEFACALPQMLTGEILEVSKGVECRTEYVPLGVVASITPFNFPNMVPCWTIPNAIVLGNCMILKPSEKVPLSAIRIAELLHEAGLPNGVLNIVNGNHIIVDAICEYPDIKAVSFVGSTKIAQKIYRNATATLKRCLALGGAKNHLLVLPDAIPEMTAQNIIASMSGCAGQRCMAASAMIGVGNIDHIIDQLCSAAKKIIPGTNLGAVINAEAKSRIETYITDAESAGAKILLDGRHTVVHGKEKGSYIGPTILDEVSPEMAVAREEIFGPVLCIMRTETLEEAIKIENSNNYGNAASVFTQNGAAARYVMEHASAGMVGVNVGVPVPREPFSFGGWNDSRFGVGDITGKSSIQFWTKLKKSTTKWTPQAGVNWMS